MRVYQDDLYQSPFYQGADVMGKMLYPFHLSFYSRLKTPNAPLVAIKLIRKLSKLLDIGMSEVEILLYLAPYTEPVSFQMICKSADHLSEDRVKRLIRNLEYHELISVIQTNEDDHGYLIKADTFVTIKSVDIQSLD